MILFLKAFGPPIEQLGQASKEEANEEEKMGLEIESGYLLEKRLVSEKVASAFHHLAGEIFGSMLTGSGIKGGMEEEATDEEGHPAMGDMDEAEPCQLVRVGSHLREHVVALLFDQSSDLGGLNTLQCSVYDLIFSQLERERDRYLSEGTSDDVVGFELVNMAASLSGTSGGRQFMSHSPTAATLLRLLSTASRRIQKQVILILKRILPGLKPGQLKRETGCDPTESLLEAMAGGVTVLRHGKEEHIGGLYEGGTALTGGSLPRIDRDMVREIGEFIVQLRLSSEVMYKSLPTKSP